MMKAEGMNLESIESLLFYGTLVDFFLDHNKAVSHKITSNSFSIQHSALIVIKHNTTQHNTQGRNASYHSTTKPPPPATTTTTTINIFLLCIVLASVAITTNNISTFATVTAFLPLLSSSRKSSIVYSNRRIFTKRINKSISTSTSTSRKMSTTTTTEDDKEGVDNDDNTNKESREQTEILPRIINSKTVASTKWLKLETLSYQDQEGKDRLWDYATRTTKQSKNSTDAVVIIPLLKRPYATKDDANANAKDFSTDSSIFDTLLVEQFRPPLGRTTLEFPAGLIDQDETPVQAALRELREETGYVGESCQIVPIVSNQVCMSPGICDEVVQCVVVVVDLDNPYNNDQHRKPNPDEGEYIKLHRVSLKDGFQQMLDTKTKQQDDQDENQDGKLLSPMAIQGLYLFAMGLEIGKSMK